MSNFAYHARGNFLESLIMLLPVTDHRVRATKRFFVSCSEQKYCFLSVLIASHTDRGVSSTKKMFSHSVACKKCDFFDRTGRKGKLSSTQYVTSPPRFVVPNCLVIVLRANDVDYHSILEIAITPLTTVKTMGITQSQAECKSRKRSS